MKSNLTIFLLFLSLGLPASAQSVVIDLGSDSFMAQENPKWKDQSGNGNDASGYGENAPTLAPGATPTGKDAMSFNGRNHMYLPNSWKGADMASFSTSPSFSILAVIRVEGSDKNHTILGGSVESIQYSIGGNGGPQSLTESNKKLLGSSSTPVPCDTWIVVGVTYDGKTISFYENGKLVDSISAYGTFAIPPVEAPYNIGNTHGGQFFEGMIAALRIYEGILGAAEMKADSDKLAGIYINK